MVTVFFSYSHRDEEFRNDLETHLSILKRQEVIETWHDRRIGAGKDVHGEISAYLEEADIILLLVSPYFLASDYCYDIEMRRALERHQKGEARVIPVIVHPCDWQNAPFGHLRATPTDGNPISKHPNKHDAYLAVAKDIRRAAEELSVTSAKSTKNTPPAKSKETAPLRIVPEVRSSNFRMKKQFSDRDKDKFLEETFDYLANFFENSLAELSSRHPEVDTNFRRVDRNRFTAAIYVNGEKKSSCRVWLGGGFGDIAYASGDLGPNNTYNETLSVVDDGYSQQLRPFGLPSFGSSDRDNLTQQGAAEYLWSMLIGNLQ